MTAEPSLSLPAQETGAQAKQVIPRDLGGGLVLRQATAADVEALLELHRLVYPLPDGSPDERLLAWTQDLTNGAHPSVRPNDFALVEDLDRGIVVSSMNLISQTWQYESVRVGVGRPELVGTRPEYRRRGLVRAQFDVIHEWSDRRGDLVQAITGIPWYYRQFGYEMAVNLGGGVGVERTRVPRLEDGEQETYRIRPATEADLPLIRRMYFQSSGRSLLSCQRDEGFWLYELGGRRELSVYRAEMGVVEAIGEGDSLTGARAIGWVAYRGFLGVGGQLAILGYELAPGEDWAGVTPAVIRQLDRAGRSYGAHEGIDYTYLHFLVTADHPIFRAARSLLGPSGRPYAWYLRVADLPRFLTQVAPVLECRLGGSPAAGYTGELRLSFYRAGLRMGFERGRLITAEPWFPGGRAAAAAAFPGLTFLQLLFGYRSLEELQYAFPDCWVEGDRVQLLLTSLFPCQPSEVWPIG